MATVTFLETTGESTTDGEQGNCGAGGNTGEWSLHPRLVDDELSA